MVSSMNEQQHRLNEEGRTIWDSKAAFWDQLHGDSGNFFHRALIAPAVERLLAVKPGEKVLDIACGNGALARRLAELGGLVTAVDFSPALIKAAQKRGQPSGETIHFAVADATDETALVNLGENSFDAVVCTMALMDIPVIAPLYRAVTHLLTRNGRFVIVTSHPAFNSNYPIFFAEDADIEGQRVAINGIKISSYLYMPPSKQCGAPGEPEPHYYYHRPMTQLLGEAFAVGLMLDGLEEPGFPPEGTDPNCPLRWVSMPQIPPVLAARFRMAG